MNTKIFFAILFFISLALNCLGINPPSNNVILHDLSNLLKITDNGNPLDTTKFYIQDISAFPETAEPISPTNVQITKYEGHYTDSINKQVFVLVTPTYEFIQTDLLWGSPYSIALIYELKKGKWKLISAFNMFKDIEMIQLHAKNKLSQIYVLRDHCNQGLCQWLETVYTFDKGRLKEAYSRFTKSSLMYYQSLLSTAYTEGSTPDIVYQQGDTLGQIELKNSFSDINNDQIKELITNEEIIIFSQIKDQNILYESLKRENTYQLINKKFTIVKSSPFIQEKKYLKIE
jgi:hypothetical protein